MRLGSFPSKRYWKWQSHWTPENRNYVAAVGKLWYKAKIAFAISSLEARARGSEDDDTPKPGPLLRDLLQAQYRARDETPYHLAIDHMPPLSKLYIKQGVERSHGSGASSPVIEVRSQTIFEAISRHRHMLVTADAGGGKSTLLTYISAQAAAWWLRDDESVTPGLEASPCGLSVPVRVSAQMLIGRSLPEAIAASVVGDLAEYMDNPAPSAEFFTHPPMADADWLVMIDGLDEIFDRHSRKRIISSLLKRAGKRTSGFRLLITSRPLPESDLYEFDLDVIAHYSLEALDEEKLTSYANAWFSSRLPNEAERKVSQFLEVVGRNNLAPVVAMPLLATIALILFEQSDILHPTLPTGRSGLYSEFLNYLLYAREGAIETRAVLQRQLFSYPHGLNIAEWLYDNLMYLLEHVAYEFLVGGNEPIPAIAKNWAKRSSPYTLDFIPGFEQTVFRLLLSTGIIVQRTVGVGFSHRSFAEYLAAGQISQQLPRHQIADIEDDFLETIFQLDDDSCALFAIGRWWAQTSIDISPLIYRLVEEDLDSTLFAAAIIAFEVRAGSAAEERLADSLSKFTRESSPDNWLEPLSSLALLPNRWYVRAGLSRIAQSKANLGIVRVAAARKLADLGDQDHGIQILKEIGNFRASTPDLEASWFEASLGLQDNTRRLELGDIDDDDFYASMPSGALVRRNYSEVL